MTMALTSLDATGERAARGNLARRAADGLSLAAAPSFALIALLLSAGGTEPQMLCVHVMSMPGASALGGMPAMYLLMSVFHLPAWLRLIQRRRTGV